MLGPVHTYPDSFVSANILLRIQKFTRPHVCGFVAFSSVHTYPPKRYEYARFAYRACAIFLFIYLLKLFIHGSHSVFLVFNGPCTHVTHIIHKR